jgi:hypothetical protein
LEEKVHEVYQWLRPSRWENGELKTNQASFAAGVGRKVILRWCLSRCYGGTHYSVEYSRRDHLRALDAVFHLLDGKQQPNSYNGELCDAIEQQTKDGKNSFQTQYFDGRCFSNRNLHLEFRRSDLLDKFNAIAGGFRLKKAV